jgi:hypothetical protein
MRRLAVSAFIAAALFGAPALAQSAVGDWAISVTTPNGTLETTMMISEADGGYAVAFEDPAPPDGQPPMESTVSDVMVDGSTFSFKRMLTTPQGPFELSYSGTVDGDSLAGTASSSFGEIPITGTRK